MLRGSISDAVGPWIASVNAAVAVNELNPYHWPYATLQVAGHPLPINSTDYKTACIYIYIYISSNLLIYSHHRLQKS